ncbi:dihydrofolate reductase [uncultured Martelella sp.]|uniref:dihydrofolate reductase n=1 Tax=uncultured Martelella sp. TaxID=392331 RepID=UPI0029C78DA7|nr:dihydrofolate reductase [uncultured Martelella sp.]
MNYPEIEMIAAVAENGVIGSNGDMPWKLSSDLKRFKAITVGKPVIMGRKTFESIGRPLPNRTNIIVTRNEGFKAENCIVINRLEDAVEIAQEEAQAVGAGSVCVIGGGEIYRQSMPYAGKLHITHVEKTLDGDTVFPKIDPAIWQVESSETVPAGEKDDYPTRYVVYVRKSG